MAKIQRKVPAADRRASRPSADSGAPTPQARVRRRIPLKHLVQFTRLLATLTEAGLPILRNLRILSNQWPEGRFRDAILDAGDLVEEGQTLSDALGQSPECFDELYVNMTRAGEAGGVLDDVLNRLADFLERAQEMRQRTKSAMTYPAVIFTVAITVVTVLLLFVIPKFATLYVDMGMTMPKPTQFLIDASNVLVNYWWLMLGLPVLIIIGHQLLYLRSYGYRRGWHNLILRTPGIGRLAERNQVSRFATTFGTLVASGVPHLEAFDITRGALTNEVYREAVDDIQAEVRDGEAIAASLGSSGMFDDMVVSMVEVGEETGELDRMCMRVGKNYEQEYTRALDDMLKLLEPTMLVTMAGVVGFIAMSLFLPLFKLLEEFGNAA